MTTAAPSSAAPSGAPANRGSIATYAVQSWRLLWDHSRRETLAVCGYTIGAALLPVAMAWVAKVVIDLVVAIRATNDATVRGEQVRHALLWVGLELLLALAAAACDRAAQLARQNAGSRLTTGVSAALAAKVLRLPLAVVERAEVNEDVQRAKREVPARPLSILQQLTTLLRSGLTLAGYGALLIRFSPWAAVGLLASTVPVLLVEARFSRSAHELRDRRTRDRRAKNYLEYVLTSVGHAKELRVFGLGRELLGRHAALGNLLAEEDCRFAARRTAASLACAVVTVVVLYGCYLAIVLHAVAGRCTVGDMSLYLLAYRSAQQALLASLSALAWIYEDQLFLDSFFRFMNLPEPTAPAVRRDRPPAREAGLWLENVGFRYEGQAGWALRHVNLALHPGTCVAIVGRNGAGKSTLIKLLTRLYAPTEGRILLDGLDLQAWDEEALRRRMTVCFQDFNRYEFTVEENVRCGDLARAADPAVMRHVLRQTHALGWVERLPRGPETQLGKWFEAGVEVSGGQWQTLALARAWYRTDADVCIFDEPTSALDAEAQARVLGVFRRNLGQKTLLLVSHDVRNIRTADRIVLLREGRVAADGTEPELLAGSSDYAALFGERRPAEATAGVVAPEGVVG